MTSAQNEDKFAQFSEMLDLEDQHGKSEQTEDGQILLGLREMLRDNSEVPPLPSGFTGSTVQSVLKKHQALTPWKKFVFDSAGFFSGRLWNSKSLASVLGLCSVFAASGYVSTNLLAVLGLVSFLAFGSWRLTQAQLDRGLPNIAVDVIRKQRRPFPLHGLSYYLVPFLSILAFSIGSGSLLLGIGTISYSFRADKDSLNLLGLLFGACVFVLLYLAFRPSLKAHRSHFGKTPWRLAVLNTSFALPPSIVAALACSNPKTLDFAGLWSGLIQIPNLAHLLGFVMLVSVPALICGVAPYQPKKDLNLKRARRQSFVSLVIGLVSISLCLGVFYQLHLTREILYPDAFESSISEVEQWVDQQMSIPDDENGWLEVKRFMIKDDVDNGLSDDIDKRLHNINEFCISDVNIFAKEPDDYERKLLKKWPKAKQEFLRELPRLRNALKKPHFSTTVTEATEGYSFDNLVPNFILMRAISQGLTLLTQEAMSEGDQEKALDYLSFGLEWSHRPNQSNRTLIGLMIRIAQLSIALDPCEQLILEGDLSAEQLDQLQISLSRGQVAKDALADSMKHEVYLVNKLLTQVQNGTREESISVFDEVPSILAIMPNSYVESERKAYINFELGRLSNWTTLSRPEVFSDEAIDPFNVANQALVASTARAQAQVMLIRSKVDAIRLMIALERYRLANDSYPDKLEQLVPAFIEELPRDTISERQWNRKPTFRYESNQDQYLLISESGVYEMVSLARRQVYGHDGDYDLQRL